MLTYDVTYYSYITMLRWRKIFPLFLLKIKVRPLNKYRISPFKFMWQTMNSGLRPHPVPDLTESFHNHAQYFKMVFP